MKCLFYMRDDETRFWGSQQVSENKGKSDVRPMLKDSIQRAGKIPKTFISDGANNFHQKYRTEFAHHTAKFRALSMSGTYALP